MKLYIHILLMLVMLVFSGCDRQKNALSAPPRLISKLGADQLAKANVVLPDYIAPWCKDNADYNVVVDAKFVSKEKLVMAHSNGFTSTAYLIVFDILDQELDCLITQ